MPCWAPVLLCKFYVLYACDLVKTAQNGCEGSYLFFPTWILVKRYEFSWGRVFFGGGIGHLELQFAYTERLTTIFLFPTGWNHVKGIVNYSRKWGGQKLFWERHIFWAERSSCKEVKEEKLKTSDANVRGSHFKIILRLSPLWFRFKMNQEGRTKKKRFF